MTVLPNTTISVLRASGHDDDGYGPGTTWDPVHEGVPATITSIDGQTVYSAGGERQIVTRRLITRMNIDIRHTDRIRDEITGETFTIEAVSTVAGALPHTVAELKVTEGVAA